MILHLKSASEPANEQIGNAIIAAQWIWNMQARYYAAGSAGHACYSISYSSETSIDITVLWKLLSGTTYCLKMMLFFSPVNNKNIKTVLFDDNLPDTLGVLSVWVKQLLLESETFRISLTTNRTCKDGHSINGTGNGDTSFFTMFDSKCCFCSRETLWISCRRRCFHQVRWPPQLAPFDEKEQQLWLELLLDDGAWGGQILSATAAHGQKS